MPHSDWGGTLWVWDLRSQCKTSHSKEKPEGTSWAKSFVPRNQIDQIRVQVMSTSSAKNGASGVIQDGVKNCKGHSRKVSTGP